MLGLRRRRRLAPAPAAAAAAVEAGEDASDSGIVADDFALGVEQEIGNGRMMITATNDSAVAEQQQQQQDDVGMSPTEAATVLADLFLYQQMQLQEPLGQQQQASPTRIRRSMQNGTVETTDEQQQLRRVVPGGVVPAHGSGQRGRDTAADLFRGQGEGHVVVNRHWQNAAGNPRNGSGHHHHGAHPPGWINFSHVYCMVSLLVALVAILTAQQDADGAPPLTKTTRPASPLTTGQSGDFETTKISRVTGTFTVEQQLDGSSVTNNRLLSISSLTDSPPAPAVVLASSPRVRTSSSSSSSTASTASEEDLRESYSLLYWKSPKRLASFAARTTKDAAATPSAPTAREDASGKSLSDVPSTDSSSIAKNKGASAERSYSETIATTATKPSATTTTSSSSFTTLSNTLAQLQKQREAVAAAAAAAAARKSGNVPAVGMNDILQDLLLLKTSFTTAVAAVAAYSSTPRVAAAAAAAAKKNDSPHDSPVRVAPAATGTATATTSTTQAGSIGTTQAPPWLRWLEIQYRALEETVPPSHYTTTTSTTATTMMKTTTASNRASLDAADFDSKSHRRHRHGMGSIGSLWLKVTASMTAETMRNLTVLDYLHSFLDPTLLHPWQPGSVPTTGTVPLSSSSSAATGSSARNDNTVNAPPLTAPSAPPSASPSSSSSSAAMVFTDLIDKILTSTPRLLAIANLLLALTYLLHGAVAEWFLGDGDSTATNQRRNTQGNNPAVAQTTAPVTLAAAASAGPDGVGGRERLGGFLVFKLLLISAVVAPDTLDLLILLSWYTLLSFLRSLAHLCAGTTALTSQSGQAPRSGVLKLLVVVLISDFLAAALCVGLFHGAGWGMVVLLTSDCALLAVDVICYILQHGAQVLEVSHAEVVSKLEEEQMQLHQRQRALHEELDQERRRESPVEESTEAEQSSSHVVYSMDDDDDDDGDSWVATESSIPASSPPSSSILMQRLQEESRQLDRRMEVIEQRHARRLAVLDTAVFVLQLMTHGLTVAHFFHIWTLHGIQFTLIDGVLALHLHSALSSASKKITERRNMHRIARDLDSMFENASDLELRKATLSGDVCCICLGTMSTGNVKKVGCGHLYHTTCLREVVERARSIQAARCPLCRASVVDGRHQDGRTNDPNNNNNNNAVRRRQGPVGNTGNVNQPNRGNAAMTGGVARRDANSPIGNNTNNAGALPNERALFRFSTEGVLPAWIPVPAFSFEVVRQQQLADGNGMNNDAAIGANNNRAPQEGPSLLHRLLVFAGAVPMTPEEEAVALEQLVDMFPQYDRADLLRELRQRRSPEGVAEAILAGLFTGVPRGTQT